jgi:hypothetical protein
MRIILRVLSPVLFVLFSLAANAHNPGESYVYLQVTDTELRGRLEITLADVHQFVPLYEGEDRSPTEAEFEARYIDIIEYLREHIAFFIDGTRHEPVFMGYNFVHIDWASFVRIGFRLPGISSPPEAIEAEYSVLFNDAVPRHRGQVLIESNSRSGIEANESQFSAIFRPGRERQTVNLDVVPWQNVFVNFVQHGVWHIWIGFDHVLFLVALLLPSVLVFRASGWEPTETFRESLIYVVKVVTLFTLAHTVTLSLAALDVIQLPVQLVEAVIALSIAAVAANNIRPFLRSKSWLLVFVFGLFHGLGFANVLAPLGGGGGNKIAALLGFNVGVEIGQLVIILVVFPLLYWLRTWVGYRRLVLQTASVALIAISCYWFLERTVDIPFLSADMFASASSASSPPGTGCEAVAMLCS